MSTSESQHEDESRKFLDLFGVSEDELIGRGIDPGEYARKNIRNALRDQTKWDGIISKSNQFGILWTRWGLRVFIALFVGIAFLVISKFQAVHWIGIAGAFTMLAVAVLAFVRSVRYRRCYVQACRGEHIEPSWRRK
jgi:hypothetical protein